MKISDKFMNHWAVYEYDHDCRSEDLSRDCADYQSISFVGKLTMPELFKIRDDCSVYDVIRYHSDDISIIDWVDKYAAVADDGEEYYIYIVDTWD